VTECLAAMAALDHVLDAQFDSVMPADVRIRVLDDLSTKGVGLVESFGPAHEPRCLKGRR
jgi:hypothetical protein